MCAAISTDLTHPPIFNHIKPAPNVATTAKHLHKSTREVVITRIENGQALARTDTIAREEPLEIRLAYGPKGQRQSRSLAVTMRTPGQDEELAAGFLFTEGIIGKAADIKAMRHVGEALAEEARENILLVELAEELPVDFDKLNRHFYTSSSCGVCGKASIDMVRSVSCYFPRRDHPLIQASTLQALPGKLSRQQAIFECTGGIHAAASFSPEGELLMVREDVGRHNALDKLIGAALFQGQMPLREQAILLSGRLSFELVQKSVMAGVPILAAVGAPSSLAVELAEEYGMTLVGFLRGSAFNVYGGEGRVALI
ncbi:MAG: formate dehydrogenase accessory sulfurtransferase FdhD [Lewinellaceae bacterium]|nr:formate dehydrogenase accessory sulfurtransferase FdhD [Phaeodactylibacter sp.]MCB9038538.1 formate dehydrogenase accessory sulfurtransferase FdhD [Lewinellaceae bacterium]